ncbi:hypothetical protein DUNSADRAFT_16075 [Dunaliella salina]|uniref:Uncharacterized protein n=1 Tax=Dunaliella salina TaxID=3046 RepID=A0ABQ7G4A1_DUNSA|nr:hypothetical protein DUNSADRAFT_16075 [Dunaliella salina]|eukprot:KAF5829432.1 hypothetical protein DUNSADRAFT_16075 [Dunaliella salina]
MCAACPLLLPTIQSGSSFFLRCRYLRRPLLHGRHKNLLPFLHTKALLGLLRRVRAGQWRISTLHWGLASRVAVRSWTVEDLVRVIPRLELDVARQVLDALFFSSQDPYLSIIDTQAILLGFPEDKRQQLCSRFKHAKIQKVLSADPNEEHSCSGSGGSEEEEGSDYDYDDDFINDNTDSESQYESAGSAGNVESD